MIVFSLRDLCVLRASAVNSKLDPFVTVSGYPDGWLGCAERIDLPEQLFDASSDLLAFRPRGLQLLG